MLDNCIYCKGSGSHGDEFTGGQSYCRCSAGLALAERERREEAERKTTEEALIIMMLTTTCCC